MGLFKPIWMTEKIEKKNKALQAVSKITDQAVLKDIAIHAPLKSVALAACERVTAENDLAEIALDNHDAFRSDISVAAAKRITDPDLSFTIARDCRWKQARDYVVDNIRDLDKMYELYQLSDKKHEYVPSFVWAIRELTDAKAIYRFLKSGKYLDSIENKLKLLEKDDLLSLASDPSVDKRIREASCERIGHVREIGCFRCVCDRCGKKLDHKFGPDDICEFCKGKKIVEHIYHKGSRWGVELQNGHITDSEHIGYVVYPDGEKVCEWRRSEHHVVNHGGIPKKR